MSWSAERFFIDQGLEYFPGSKHGGPSWVNIQCPLCPDKSDHGRFNTNSGEYHCYRCGKHNPVYVVSVITGLRRQKAKELWDSYFVGGADYYLVGQKERKRTTSVELPGEPLQQQHKAYIRKRGLNPKRIEKVYRIQGTGLVGDWRNRLIMPFFDRSGKILTFQTRSIRVKNYKCLAPEKSVLSMKELLYAEWLIDDKKRIGVCEGPVDAWNMGIGFVATCGIGCTPFQIDLLLLYEKVYILFDPEPTAQIRALKLAKKIASFGKNVEVIDTGGKADPGELPKKEVKYIRKELNFAV